jgi:hypothetical protein
MTAATTIVSSGEFSPSSWVLLNKYAQVGENSNETTAHCQVSDDLKIYASLSRECPPLPSNLYVYCSGATFAEPPSSLSMVDDLILFHVYTGPPFRSRSGLPSYFFLYRADPKRPSLSSYYRTRKVWSGNTIHSVSSLAGEITTLLPR